MCARRVGAAIVILALLAGLATVALASVRAFAVVSVGGESMHPALHVGDVCLISRRALIRNGDVVLCEEPGHRGAVLHRVVGRAVDGLVTRGDANPVADFDHLPFAAVRGRVIGIAPVGALIERWRRKVGGDTLHNQSQTARL